jgi:small redox-active disulfide protein 2
VKIAILGPNCSRCRQTAEAVRQAVLRAGVEATIVKVEDLREIMKLQVMKTPAVAIDGKVRISGRIPTVDEVVELLSRGGAA